MEVFGVPLLALTALGLLAAGIACVILIRRRRAPAAQTIALVTTAWLGAYAAVRPLTRAILSH